MARTASQGRGFQGASCDRIINARVQAPDESDRHEHMTPPDVDPDHREPADRVLTRRRFSSPVRLGPHRDNLAATLAGTATPVPSYPSVRRYLKAHGMVRRATPKRDTAGALAARDRLEQREVRSFEVEHVAALWHLDFHHGSRKVLTAAGTWLTPLYQQPLGRRVEVLMRSGVYSAEC